MKDLRNEDIESTCHCELGSLNADLVVKVGSRKWGSAMQHHSCILFCSMFTYLSHFFVFSSNVSPRLALVFKTKAFICELLQVFFNTPYQLWLKQCLYCFFLFGEHMSIFVYLQGYLSQSKTTSLRSQVTSNILHDWYFALLSRVHCMLAEE